MTSVARIATTPRGGGVEATQTATNVNGTGDASAAAAVLGPFAEPCVTVSAGDAGLGAEAVSLIHSARHFRGLGKSVVWDFSSAAATCACATEANEAADEGGESATRGVLRRGVLATREADEEAAAEAPAAGNTPLAKCDPDDNNGWSSMFDSASIVQPPSREASLGSCARVGPGDAAVVAAALASAPEETSAERLNDDGTGTTDALCDVARGVWRPSPSMQAQVDATVDALGGDLERVVVFHVAPGGDGGELPDGYDMDVERRVRDVAALMRATGGADRLAPTRVEDGEEGESTAREDRDEDASNVRLDLHPHPQPAEKTGGVASPTAAAPGNTPGNAPAEDTSMTLMDRFNAWLAKHDGGRLAQAGGARRLLASKRKRVGSEKDADGAASSSDTEPLRSSKRKRQAVDSEAAAEASSPESTPVRTSERRHKAARLAASPGQSDAGGGRAGKTRRGTAGDAKEAALEADPEPAPRGTHVAKEDATLLQRSREMFQSFQLEMEARATAAAAEEEARRASSEEDAASVTAAARRRVNKALGVGTLGTDGSEGWRCVVVGNDAAAARRVSAAVAAAELPCRVTDRVAARGVPTSPAARCGQATAEVVDVELIARAGHAVGAAPAPAVRLAALLQRCREARLDIDDWAGMSVNKLSSSPA